MAINERGAGRKKALDNKRIEEYRKRFQNGERIYVLAEEAGVSRQTMSAYLHEECLDGGIFYRYNLWAKLNREFRNQNLHQYRLRIDYMDADNCCSVILVDFFHEKVEVINKTQNPILESGAWPHYRTVTKRICIPQD